MRGKKLNWVRKEVNKMLGFEALIAWRFLKSTKSQTLLILTGIIVGVAVQVFLSSLITGLQANLIGQTVGDAPHVFMSSQENSKKLYQSSENTLVITRTSSIDKDSSLSNWQQIFFKLKSRSDIAEVSPMVNGSGFITKGESTQPIILKGILLAEADNIYRIKTRIIKGRPVVGGNNALIGQELAEKYKLSPGDIFQLTTAKGNISSLMVGGIFDFENQSINSSWMFIDLYRAQTLLDTGGNISLFEMQIPNVFDSEKISTLLQSNYPDFLIETWQDKNAQLVNGLKSQSSSSVIIQVFVLLSVTLGIASVLAVSAFQRSKQIGILKAMGAKNSSLSSIFFLQGSILGLTGSLLGSGMGILLVQAFLYFTSLNTGVPLFDISIEKISILYSVIISTTASTLAAIAPARKAAALTPIEVIRNG